ncbi:MAG: hypothetical protein KJI71_00945 [Patescibacteria group bacterium]|nr:hypothetical protein [Patescibacteria group bacterium]
MKFKTKNGKKGNIMNIARKIGYIYQREDKEREETSLVRSFGRGGYPRFHLYLKMDIKNQELIFNLHLDQKKPVYPTRKPSHSQKDSRFPWRITSDKIYKGAPAHSADYEGPVIEEEMERIKEALQKE